MHEFIAKHQDQIAGTLSGFDRLVFRGTLRSIAHDEGMKRYQNPKPFVWTATVESIQEKLTRRRRTLEQIQPACTSPKYRKRRQ
jgi:hypothetical protein